MQRRTIDTSVCRYPFAQNQCDRPHNRMKEATIRTHLCVLSTPFGATLSSSSAPKMFCLPPFGCGCAGPNSASKSGLEIISRNRRDERWRLLLHVSHGGLGQRCKHASENKSRGGVPDGREFISTWAPASRSYQALSIRLYCKGRVRTGTGV